MIDLSSYTSLHSSLFVRIQVDEYRTTAGGAYTEEVLTFTDHYENYTINSEVYQNVGNLMSVTASRSQIKASGSGVSIALSGIPNSAIAEIVNSKLKSCPVRIYRGYFDSNNQLIGSLQGRFRGFVNNYSLEEEYDIDARTATNTILIECASSIDVLNNKYAGRRTNPESEKKYFVNDIGFDRVPNLENTTFNFGAPE
jgi:hypothetical protein